jgi:uncharacterized membrane protein YfcA
MTFAELFAIGLMVGAFVGISGVGGGSIMTPLLILVLGINPLAAVGTDLMYSVPTKIFGAYLHSKQETLHWKLVGQLCAGGLPGAALGLAALFYLRAHSDAPTVNWIIRHAVGAALILAAIALIVGIFTQLRRGADEAPVEQPYSTPAVVAGGAVTGFIVAVTSIGSGAVMLPLLLLIAPSVGLRRLIGTDIAFAAILIPLAAGGHAVLRDVNFPVAGALLAGSLPGVFIGSKLCRYLPEIWLRPAVAVVLLIAASRLL